MDPSKVLARPTFKLPSNADDPMEVGVVSLIVTWKIATLRLVFIPTSVGVDDQGLLAC